MNAAHPRLGYGIGWRPDLALWIDRRSDLGFVEIVAENFEQLESLPSSLDRLREREVAVVPHGISLSLGGADLPDISRLDQLARLAEHLDAPLVSEHIAFVRASGVEAGHLLPVPHTAEALDVLTENVIAAQAALPVPLALENISTLVEWPDAELAEVDFIRQLVERTGVWLLLDIANVYANATNHSGNPTQFVDRYPCDRVAYVHVGGGTMRDGVYHDTHADAVVPEVFQLLQYLSSHAPLPGVMLERDDQFPADDELTLEFENMIAAQQAGDEARLRGCALQ